jgi:hypothetical protein
MPRQPQIPGTVKLLLPPRQSRGVSHRTSRLVLTSPLPVSIRVLMTMAVLPLPTRLQLLVGFKPTGILRPVSLKLEQSQMPVRYLRTTNLPVS